jgi:tRNA1Val (adenine37-N6)-methyltransferase
MSIFRFKEFSIIQNRSSMKVGTDAMILGSLIDVNLKGKCLEIGTGTGVISLMLLQRSPELFITAIDIDSESTEEAIQNFSNSPWISRVQTENCDFLNYNPDLKFDIIVTNPPYFENGLLNNSKRKAVSRHENSLPLITLFEKSSRLLSEKGNFWLILPFENALNWKNKSKYFDLFCRLEVTILGKPNLPKRTVFCFTKEEVEYNHKNLIIRNDDNLYMEEYKELTLDFHGVIL